MVDFKAIARRASSVKVDGEWVELRWPEREQKSAIWELVMQQSGQTGTSANGAVTEQQDDLEALERQIDQAQDEMPAEEAVVNAQGSEGKLLDNMVWWDDIASMALAATVVTDDEMTVADWKAVIIASEVEEAMEGLGDLVTEAMRLCGIKRVTSPFSARPNVQDHAEEVVKEAGEVPSE